jgi:hypothetical protein
MQDANAPKASAKDSPDAPHAGKAQAAPLAKSESVQTRANAPDEHGGFSAGPHFQDWHRSAKKQSGS